MRLLETAAGFCLVALITGAVADPVAAIHAPKGRDDGWAVGDAGTSLFTVDGGETWTPVNLTAEDLGDVAFATPAIGLIVGDNGVIRRTTNGGIAVRFLVATGRRRRSVGAGGVRRRASPP